MLSVSSLTVTVDILLYIINTHAKIVEYYFIVMRLNMHGYPILCHVLAVDCHNTDIIKYIVKAVGNAARAVAYTCM